MDVTGRDASPGSRFRRHLGRAEPRRRPSGEPPPLPHDLGRSGRFWIFMVGYALTVLLGVLLFNPLAGVFERFDTLRLRWIANLRTPGLTKVMLFLNGFTSRWTIRGLRWGTLLVLVVFRRWRHLLVLIGALFALEILAYQLVTFIGRPRPLGIQIIGDWDGYSMPSRPLAGLAVSLVGVAYTVVVAGRSRDIAKWAVGATLLAVIFARMYLAVDQPTSAGFGAVFGVAVGLVAFRWFCPNDIFPVTYKRRGKAAHLDVGGLRGLAIGRAVSDQLGLEVVDIKPVGLEGSGGSTPLRLRVRADDQERYVFAKLYAKSHVRADRWYKLGRTILYGALEDESPFQSVRRFVEYEDYTLRLLQDHEMPSPEAFGVVEITPQREYMIVMEFFEGAVELGEAEIDESVIDQGLALIKRMWDAGLAHRDVKPANLMVRDGELKLIDVFFVQVRPSPWRQAVDLANMMMVLALRSSPELVYERAKLCFTEDELAEAFAAARGVASPTQLRTMMKEDGRDILLRFRELAPERRPVRIQRWTVRRVVLAVSAVVGAWIALLLVLNNWTVFA